MTSPRRLTRIAGVLYLLVGIFGREYGIDTLLARAIAMSAGYHLDVRGLGANETLAEEARELACSLSITPPVISAGLDL